MSWIWKLEVQLLLLVANNLLKSKNLVTTIFDLSGALRLPIALH
jgi:hypothetical protein